MISVAGWSRRTGFAMSVVFLLAFAAACSTFSDPIGCEYHPNGESSMAFTLPTPSNLGEFDALLMVKITEENGSEFAAIVKDSVAGGLSDGERVRLTSDFGLCLETGDEYYVIADSTAGGELFEIPHPWSTFPVINNRITLHQDMRKDELVGEMHGLDPVLFKRRFVELVGRDDIEVE